MSISNYYSVVSTTSYSTVGLILKCLVARRMLRTCQPCLKQFAHFALFLDRQGGPCGSSIRFQVKMIPIQQMIYASGQWDLIPGELLCQRPAMYLVMRA